MTRNIEPLSMIAKIDPASPAAAKVPQLREPVLATTGVGLGIAGMILERIRREITNPMDRQPYITALFTKVRWLRSPSVRG